MAITFRDFITFPFNGGRGIRGSQIDGRIDRANLPLGVGAGQNLFVATLMDYDSGTATITGEIDNLAAFPLGSLVYGVFPDTIDLARVALSLDVDGTPRALLDIDGRTVWAAQLTPGRIYGLIRTTDGLRFLEEFGVRPGRYFIRTAASLAPLVTVAEILAGNRSTTQFIALVPFTTPHYHQFGVPDNSPDITDIIIPATGASQFAFVQRVPGTVTVEGVAYKWWRGNGIAATNDNITPYEVVQG